MTQLTTREKLQILKTIQEHVETLIGEIEADVLHNQIDLTEQTVDQPFVTDCINDAIEAINHCISDIPSEDDLSDE